MKKKKPDFEKMFNELSQKYSDTLSELETYQHKIVPKFNVGQTIYAAHPRNVEPLKIVVDRIEISKMGVSYTEFVDEKSMKHMPEMFCFDNLTEAKENLKYLKENKELMEIKIQK